MARLKFIRDVLILTVSQIFIFLLAAYTSQIHSLNSFFIIFCFWIAGTFSWFYFYPRIETPQERPLAQPEIPGKTALSGSELILPSRRVFQADDDVITISACFVDSVETVGDIDTDTQYDNGPFLKSWVDLGSIKEILEILRPGYEYLIDLQSISFLLEGAYSQPDKEPDLFYRNSVYKYHAIIDRMKKLTFGNRLFKTATLSRLGVGPRTIQKGDLIYFAPGDSNFLVVRRLSLKNSRKSYYQPQYGLIGEASMGDIANWSDKQPVLSTAPLQTLILQQEKTGEWTEEAYNSNAKLRSRSLWFAPASKNFDSDAMEESINAKSGAYRERKRSRTRHRTRPWIRPESSPFNDDATEQSINAKSKAYRVQNAPQSRSLKRPRTATKWSITSMIEAYQGTERLTAAGTGSSRYMTFWKCNCGHLGFDQYDELHPGAVHDLLKVFEKHGIKAFIEGCDPNRPNPPYLKYVRLEIFITNLYTWLRNKAWPSPVAMRHDRSSDTVEDSSPSFKTAAGPTNGASSSSQSRNANTLNVNQQAPVATGAATGTSATSAQSNQPSPSPATHTQGNNATINIRDDFILLCMKVKRFLTARHDLQVTMTRDRELFEAFRRQYHSKFGWAYRQFSFQTIQKISFVKFALHPRHEVDGIQPDMPPEAATHYTCDPRRPDREPALGNNFLMHRFSSPINCFQDDICLRQFPKRVGERPTPGIDPDFYTGWGIHLEQGLDLQRIFLVLFFGIASAGTFGLIWGVCKSVQDGFSIASFIVGSEAVAVAMVQILLSVGAI